MVKITTIFKQREQNLPQYEDKSEAVLNKIFSLKKSQRLQIIHQILSNPQANLTLYYHLSPQRQFILYPLAIGKKDNALELGAGCGAVTGYLCHQAKKVVALELNPNRAKIISKRHQNCQNLEVVIGNLAAYQPKNKFDWIIMIGLLEYAGRFFQPNPDNIFQAPVNLLKLIKNWLKPQGKIAVAIENRLGYKYLIGKYEDHYYKRRFESINNYPHYNGTATFSKSELINIFNQAGFKHQRFFYPFPDYKHPTLIIDEEDINNPELPTYLIPYSQEIPPSKAIFPIKEKLFLKDLIRDKLLSRFSNSFLIVAS